ncbi:MAG TPA: hypothetical protein VFV75_19895 [Candidatus Polarisedimenticolaceae bacterium]|nr:hypothetical protein [Candidatus Polarisedimenticolaceae bacterium]
MATPAALLLSAVLVVCAPHHPGTTADAQPTMDALAAAAARAAGWPAGSLAAEYHAVEAEGTARLARPDAVLALVTEPYFVEHGAALKLKPLLQALSAGSEEGETWSLVARKGRVTDPASLAGWELHSSAAYAPRFVRETALGTWGKLPGDVQLVPTAQVLSALRKAASGSDVAVLLDGTQAAALRTLPFASDLEVVARSPRLPAALLCSVGGRALPGPLDPLKAGMRALDPALLGQLRLARFAPLPE